MSKNIITQSLKGKLFAENISYEYKGNNFNGAKFILMLPIESDTK